MAIPPAPVEGAPVVPDPAPVVPTSGPWARDLETRFADPEVRAAVDGFLRESVQPHVTRLEQTATDAKDAMQLYQDLIDNPGETYLALTQELLGDDQAERVYQALQAGDIVEKPDGDGGTDLVVKNEGALSPEQLALLEEVQNERDLARYNAAIDSTIEAHKEEYEIVKDLFHPFIHAAGGDMEKAAQGYKVHYDQFVAKFGAPPEGAPAAPGAPPTLGSTGAVTAPPVQKDYHSLDDALNDFFEEQKVAPRTI